MIVSSSASLGFWAGSGGGDSSDPTISITDSQLTVRRGEKEERGDVPSFIPSHSCSRSSGIVTLSFGFRDKHFFMHAITCTGTRRLRWSSFFGGLPEVPERTVGVACSGNSIAYAASGIAFIFW